MQRQPRSPVVSQQDAHIHSAERVRLENHTSDAEGFRHVLSLPRISPPNEDARGIRRGSGPEEDDVQSSLPEGASRRPRETRTPRAVQHFHPDAFSGRRNGIRVAGHLLASGLKQQRQHAEQRERARRD